MPFLRANGLLGKVCGIEAMFLTGNSFTTFGIAGVNNVQWKQKIETENVVNNWL